MPDWLEFTIARVLGVKHVAEDSGYRMTSYCWHGKIYVTEWKEKL